MGSDNPIKYHNTWISYNYMSHYMEHIFPMISVYVDFKRWFSHVFPSQVAGSAHAAGRALRQLCEDLLRPLGLSDDQKRPFGRNMGGKWVENTGINIYQWMDSGNINGIIWDYPHL